MRHAPSGESGTVIGPDYRGVTVLAAHEPLAELDMGIVAKIDLPEIRELFVRAIGITGVFGLLIVLSGAGLFLRFSNPIIRNLKEEKEFNDSILNGIVETVFVFNLKNGEPVRWNGALNEISGYTDEEIASKKAQDEWYNKEDLKRPQKAL